MKSIGLILIVSCFSSVGLYFSYKTKTSVKQLYEMLNLMKYIRNQIEFFSTPIPDIYESFTAKNKEVERFIHDVSTEDWNTALNKTDKLYFSEKVNDILKKFGEGLGKSNKEQQLIHCDYYIKALEKEYEETEKNAPNKIKITLALSLYAGLMLLILFI